MIHTSLIRTLSEPPTHAQAQLDQLLPNHNYHWTGYSGHRYGLKIVWELEKRVFCVAKRPLWMIDDRVLLLVDTVRESFAKQSDP